jgi:hypothetical protein
MEYSVSQLYLMRNCRLIRYWYIEARIQCPYYGLLWGRNMMYKLGSTESGCGRGGFQLGTIFGV